MFGFGLGGSLLALAAIAIWILILVWLAQRILRFVGLRTGWRPHDLRNMGLAFLLLTGAIHLGNHALDLIERSVSDSDHPLSLGFPSAFLIGSVAIAVGIAAVRWNRKQRDEK